MSTTRRGFLKACAAVAAGAIIIPDFRLIEPDAPLFDGESLVAEVRELVQYSLNYGGLEFLYSIIGPGNNHISVNAFLENAPLSAYHLEKVRQPCAAALQREMRARGWKLKDLRPWPKDPVQFQSVQRSQGIWLFGQSTTELWT